ncbi:excisionase [Vibrio sp. PNB22_4_1]|uniref:excisionase n=1 Tax=unclassified Vibrio TaxID=2614977 RepID=UPI00406A0DA1
MEDKTNHSEYITLQEWCTLKFGYVPSPTTLSQYRKTKQIYPLPVRFGRKYMCRRDAEFIGLSDMPSESANDDPLLNRILSNGI